LPSVSSVRRAIVKAPTATAAPPRTIPGFIARSPLPTSGAMAFAMFEVPEENAMTQPIATTTTVPAISRRVVLGPYSGRGIDPERSTASNGPSV